MADHELIDALDDNGTPVGVVARGEAHRLGIWHRAFHCWIMAQEHDRPYLLFQRRSAAKTLFPNMLDVTVGGHLLAGETVADGLRELEEELGLVVHLPDLVRLGQRIECRHVGLILDREFAEVFLLECQQPLQTYRLQAAEVTAIVRLAIDDGLRLFSRESDAASITGVELDEWGQLVPVVSEVTRAAFVPRPDSYYLTVCIMVQRCFQGHRYLAI